MPLCVVKTISEAWDGRMVVLPKVVTGRGGFRRVDDMLLYMSDGNENSYRYGWMLPVRHLVFICC
jgi:hypothetical protein